MMSQRVECPSSGRGLVVAESARGERVTCPRCLAEVDVPATRGDGNAVQQDRPERRETGMACPHCRREVQAVWIACPWCEEPLRGRDPRGYGRADLDVRRDRKWTGIVVIILAVLGGVGVAILGFNAFAIFAEAQTVEPMIYLAVALLFLAGLTTLIVFVRSRGNPGAGGFRRVFVGTLAIAGGLMVFGTCAGFAIFIFVFAMCLAGGGRGL